MSFKNENELNQSEFIKNVYKFGEICEVLNGRAYKKNELLESGKYTVLRVGNFFSSDNWYYSDLELDANKYCDNGDLLFAWSASFGPKIWDGGKVIYHYHIWKLIPSSFVDKKYLYYWLLYSRNSMLRGVHGSVMGHLTKSSFEKQKISLPDIFEQKAIANILSSLDEKIEVNNQINKKLEEMAQAIFKQWFVDFEFPNEEGKPYKSSGGAMVESELGMIPEGWEVKTLENLCDANQASKSNKEEWEFINYLDTGNITRNCIDNIQRLDTIADKIPSRAKRKIKQNDIVYSTVRPNQHHHGIVKVPVENMLASTGFVVLTSKGRYSNDLIYLWLNQEETTIKLQSIAEQSTSTYPSIKPSDILSIKVLVPLEKQLNELSDTIELQNNQIWSNQQQNQKLSLIRDTLLPKLMSGELRVPVENE